MQRSMVLRCLYASRSKSGGLPPGLPRRRRWLRWSAGGGGGCPDSALVAGARGSRGRSTPCRPVLPPAWCGAGEACEDGCVTGLSGGARECRGRQWASEARWIFAVSSPRDRPMAWSAPVRLLGPPFRAQAACWCARAGRVDRDGPVEVFVGVGLGDQPGEHLLPHAVDAPHPQPVAETPPVAVFLRQVHPLRAGLELVGDRVDHLTMIPPPATPRWRPVPGVHPARRLGGDGPCGMFGSGGCRRASSQT